MSAAALAAPAVLALPAGLSLAAGMTLAAHAARRRLAQGVEVRARKARVANAPRPKPRNWTGTALEAGAGVMLASAAMPGAGLLACGAAAFAGARGLTRLRTWGTRLGLLEPGPPPAEGQAAGSAAGPGDGAYRDWDFDTRGTTEDLARPVAGKSSHETLRDAAMQQRPAPGTPAAAAVNRVSGLQKRLLASAGAPDRGADPAGRAPAGGAGSAPAQGRGQARAR